MNIAGQTYFGSGKKVFVTWDGKNPDGTVVDPGTYAATLQAWHTNDPSCSDSKTLTFTVQPSDNNCSRSVTFGSSANVASGNLSHSQALFSTKGTGLATNMTLYYNSLDPYSGPLGRGWVHNYDISLKQNSDGAIVLRDGTGRKRLYTKSGSSYISQPGDYSVLVANDDGTFTLTHQDGTKYNFGTDGKITSIIDRNGNALTFGYINDNLTTISDPAGRITTISYDPANHITSITDPSGNVYGFTVTNNMLASVTYPGNGAWSYTYDANAYMLTKTDPNGNTTTYTYDDRHRISSSLDAQGNSRHMNYPTGTDATKTSTFTETDGGVWQYSYDTHAGTLTSKTDPSGNTTSYTYDQNRNMLSKTGPDNTTTTYTYDGSGNMTSTTNALGQTTSYTYNSFGQLTSTTDSQNNTTTYSYDPKGNLLATTDPTGATTQYQYDAKGNVTAVTNAAGQTTTYVYDQQNDLVSITDPTGAKTTFTYDANGNITSQTDAKGNKTTFAYDSQNHLVSVTDPVGHTTTYAYDKNGNKIFQTDADGNKTYYTYNSQNQLIQVKDALGNATVYAYGSTGGSGCSSCGQGSGDKLTTVVDAKGNTTTYQYDTLGHLIKEIDPLGNTISYTYDAKGNLSTKTDANGNTITYTYDSLGRLLTKTYPDNTTTAFTYDVKGNILTAANKDIGYTFTYDSNGRMLSVIDSDKYAVSYKYDSLGNRTRMTYPDGSKITYAYDTANRLSTITGDDAQPFTFRYDGLGRRTNLLYPNGEVANYSYDTAGRLTSLVYNTSRGAVIDRFDYTLDNVGNRLTKTDPDVQYTYQYDAIYRLLQATPAEMHGRGRDAEYEQGTEHEAHYGQESFTYDPVGNRLTGPGTRLIYTNNQDNQLTEKSMQERQNESKKSQYTYDKNGNLIKKTSPRDDGRAETWTYGYDYENRLVKAAKEEDNGATIITYEYDPFGRRIEKQVLEIEDGRSETMTYDYVYDNNNIILEDDTKSEDNQSRTETTRYIQGPNTDEHLAIEKRHETYYYHADGLGSITSLTDKKQRIVTTYDYDSFGNLKRHGDRVKQPYTFTGREWDKEAGLYYYRARYYDAKAGRFIQKDPIGFKGGINLYAYASNNPINLTDPEGLCDGQWQQAGYDRVFNFVCKCYWLCIPCDGPVIWSGNYQSLPFTYGNMINSPEGGGAGAKRGDACLCDKPT